MAFLNESQIQSIKEHMIANDDARLKSKFKSKNTAYDYLSVDLNEIETYQKDGWEVITILKKKAKMQKEKDCGRQFEDSIWCLFYNLGFRILNYDENLVVQWGTNSGDHQQLDVVAVGDDAIFVVECKASGRLKSANFKKDIDNILQYKDGVTKALKQIYGTEKKVKFIFATNNFRFPENSEDLKRLKERKIYHLNENSYNYIKNLIKAYKESVIYQFYGLLFKDELINNERIRIPALKGSMGGRDYYMLSIEPSKLLKIGFVLHRTKVNDSMAPTYQRLLVPSRLKGITKFINEGGYFPNSIIINFDTTNKKNEIRFEPSEKSDLSKSRFGYLSIPNAYGIAYIIDGQHRVYGYAGSKFKDSNTIPVVAFNNMESYEQLKIFMDINENQKAVSPSLRLDLAEDINWESPRVDSRMLALRSSIIKSLSQDSNSILYTKISVGEDNARLTFKPFDTALSKSSLLPKASNKKFLQDTDVCLYDCNNQDFNQAMIEARKRISGLIRSCYSYMQEVLNDDLYQTYIECNRGTYAFVVLIGTLNKYLIQQGMLTKQSSIEEQSSAMAKFFNVLSEYLSNISVEHKNILLNSKGQGADTTWLHMYENAINQVYTDYMPEGLQEWKETQDKNLQEEGSKIGEEIEKILRHRVLSKLEDLYGDKWEKNIFETKAKCLQRMADIGDENVEEESWTDYLQVTDYKDIIEKNWQINNDDETFKPFCEEFSIQINDQFKSKKDKMKWLTDFIQIRTAQKSTKGKPLNKIQVNELNIILQSLRPIE